MTAAPRRVLAAGPRRHDDRDGDADKDRPVTCDSDTIEAGGRLYKVGTHRAQRVFKARPWHDGAAFELLRLEEHD